MSTDNSVVPKELTLSIVSHGHGPLVAALLDDLSKLPSAHQMHLVLTLNLPDEVVDARSWPNLSIQVIRNPEPRGFGANHNGAFQLCRSPWFVVLNPDIRISQDPFPTLLAAASLAPEIAALSPRIVNANGEVEDHVRTNLSPLSLWRRLRGKEKAPDVSSPSTLGGKFYWLAGMFVAFRSTSYRSIRGFDERFFLYCEDYDICARLWIEGGRLALVPDAIATHRAQRDSHRSLSHLRWHVCSLIKVWTSLPFWQIVHRTIVSGRN